MFKQCSKYTACVAFRATPMPVRTMGARRLRSGAPRRQVSVQGMQADDVALAVAEHPDIADVFAQEGFRYDDLAARRFYTVEYRREIFPSVDVYANAGRVRTGRSEE